jgi:hypothetical protein
MVTLKSPQLESDGRLKFVSFVNTNETPVRSEFSPVKTSDSKTKNNLLFTPISKLDIDALLDSGKFGVNKFGLFLSTFIETLTTTFLAE